MLDKNNIVSTLQNCFEAVGRSVPTKSADIENILMNKLPFRRWRPLSKKEMKELVVPIKLQTFVLKMAQKDFFGGKKELNAPQIGS